MNFLWPPEKKCGPARSFDKRRGIHAIFAARGREASLSLSLEMDFTRSTREINAVKIQEGKASLEKVRISDRSPAHRISAEITTKPRGSK